MNVELRMSKEGSILTDSRPISNNMTRNEWIELGYISKGHGLRGEMKAVFDVHDIDEYKDLPTVYLAKGDQPLKAFRLRKFQIRSQKHVTLAFQDINDRNGADALVGHTLFLPESDLAKLEEGHFYYFEVIGFQVIDQELGKLGTISGFYDGPAQDVMAMQYKGKEVLIPITDSFVLQADMEAQCVHTHLPEGLVESYLED